MGDHSHGSPEESGTVAKADDVAQDRFPDPGLPHIVRVSQIAIRAQPSDTSAKLRCYLPSPSLARCSSSWLTSSWVTWAK